MINLLESILNVFISIFHYLLPTSNTERRKQSRKSSLSSPAKMSFGPHQPPQPSKRSLNPIAQLSIPPISTKKRVSTNTQSGVDGKKNHSTVPLALALPLYADIYRLSILRTDTVERLNKYQGERGALEGVLERLENEFGEKLHRKRIELELDLLGELDHGRIRIGGDEGVGETLVRVVDLFRRCDLVIRGTNGEYVTVEIIRESSVRNVGVQ